MADPSLPRRRIGHVTHDDCEQVSRLAPGFALGALDPEESAELRDHLATCGRRHPELREAMALAAAMADSALDALPSAALRARVLAAAASETSAHAAPVASERRNDRGPVAWWRAIAAGTTAVALAASVALGVQLGENRSLTERVAAVEGRLAAVASDLETARSWIDRAVARGATAYFMDGEGDARQASFMLVVEPDAAGAMLLMSGLPRLSSSETYELWVEREGAIVGVGTFVPDERGIAALTIDASLGGIGQAMITVEPEGGSAAPSDGEVIMQGELPFREG